MSVERHPTKKETGWWRIVYRPEGRHGKQRRITVQGSYEEVLEMERIIRQSTRRDEITPAAPSLVDVYLDFIKWYANEVSPSTLRDARSVIPLHVIPFFGDLRPSEISRPLVSQYKHSRLDRAKPKTINKELSYLNSILKWMYENGYASDLVRAAYFPAKRTQPAPKKPLTERQLTAIVEHVDPQYRLPFLLMADAGLRMTEALTLRAEDVNEHNQTMTVQGKGAKYRTIPWMTERLQAGIIRAIDRSPAGYLTVNPMTKRPFGDLRKALRRAVKAAEINVHVHHHLLRHSFASNAAMRGVNPHWLQYVLGHESIITTNKIYTHVNGGFIKDEQKKLSGGLSHV